MNRKGQFGIVILLVLAFLLVYAWLIISPVAVEPFIDSTIAATSGSPNGDAIAFFLRMIPWAVPVILIIGFLYWGFSG
jgi:hypothetical protein